MSDELERVSVDGKVHDAQRLKELQSLPLWRKIQITQTRIIEWYQYYEGKVYIAFSGGKDSTVLVNIARKIYPDIECVFVDTGLEYSAVRDFVKTIENVIWLKSEMRFDEVIKKYGYPLISKEVSRDVSVAKRNPNGKTAKRFERDSDYCKKYGDRYCLERYKYLLDAPFDISNQCCNVMKKKPSKKYGKDTKKHTIIATMATESNLRKQDWFKTGCNAFENENPQSKPMSFWTENDVLEYIDTYKIPYANVYGEIIRDEKGKYKTTGLNRTGCVFCGFGCQSEKSPTRFEQLKEIDRPKWEYCMRPIEENGLGMGTVLDYINVKWGKEENIKDK